MIFFTQQHRTCMVTPAMLLHIGGSIACTVSERVNGKQTQMWRHSVLERFDKKQLPMHYFESLYRTRVQTSRVLDLFWGFQTKCQQMSAVVLGTCSC
jgi:hypothetical protein